jgi:glycopeptide antibiotics resistance protein
MRFLCSKLPLLLLILYVGVLLYGTLTPFRFTWNPGRDKMNPRRQIEWIPFAHRCAIHGLACPQEVGLNVAVFLPVGALAALIRGTGVLRRVALAGILGFSLSLMIETAQYFIPERFPGTTDLLWNTLGACLGGLMAAGLVRVTIRKLKPAVMPRSRPA